MQHTNREKIRQFFLFSVFDRGKKRISGISLAREWSDEMWVNWNNSNKIKHNTQIEKNRPRGKNGQQNSKTCGNKRFVLFHTCIFIGRIKSNSLVCLLPVYMCVFVVIALLLLSFFVHSRRHCCRERCCCCCFECCTFFCLCYRSFSLCKEC